VETFAFGYVLYRFFYRIFAFFRNWYIGGFYVVARRTISFLETLDWIFAWHATLRNFFQPLYQDHTVVGHLFGAVFRSFRLIAGTVFYAVVIAVAIAAYLAWALLPPAILYKGFFS